MFGEEDDPDTFSGSDDSDDGRYYIEEAILTSEGPNDNWITSLSFDVTGTYLAVGYNCGQVVILKQQDEQTYQLYSEFKSHDVAFDFLTSVEIEEKINVIKWFPFKQAQHPKLMTTNGSRHLKTPTLILLDKTIKLFKMQEKPSRDGNTLDIHVKTERVFESGHAYNINGIAFNPDGETFVSSDDLRINLWNLNNKDEAFMLVDMKPENMEELNEVITCTDFHPLSCNMLVYSSTRGINRLVDLRESALCDSAKGLFHPIQPLFISRIL